MHRSYLAIKSELEILDGIRAKSSSQRIRIVHGLLILFVSSRIDPRRPCFIRVRLGRSRTWCSGLVLEGFHCSTARDRVFPIANRRVCALMYTRCLVVGLNSNCEVSLWAPAKEDVAEEWIIVSFAECNLSWTCLMLKRFRTLRLSSTATMYKNRWPTHPSLTSVLKLS